ncbi:MAG: hypothetical protein ACRCWI_08705 [Brevinema sp.]
MFLLAPSRIKGGGKNYHLFSGERINNKDTISKKSLCGLVERLDTNSNSDQYFASTAELIIFLKKTSDQRICASCSDMHKHADLR